MKCEACGYSRTGICRAGLNELLPQPLRKVDTRAQGTMTCRKAFSCIQWPVMQLKLRATNGLIGPIQGSLHRCPVGLACVTRHATTHSIVWPTEIAQP